MAEYKHRFEQVGKDHTIDIPDDAVGVTVGAFGLMWNVHYAVPAGADDD